MANLINANSNQNYFQFHGSNYKYEKGALRVTKSFVTLSMEFTVFKRCRYQYDDSTHSWCTGCYQVCSIWDYMATMAVAKGMLHNPNQYTDLLMIH